MKSACVGLLSIIDIYEIWYEYCATGGYTNFV